MQDLKAIRYISDSKVSHDYEGDIVTTFSYLDLVQRNSPAIGIPCKQNGLIVIDIDVVGEAHKHDGREFWKKFCEENSIPSTYVVSTRSGGYHFYFWLPPSIDPDTYQPPKQLALGVDVKFNGWVAAPPSPGYEVLEGNTGTIAVAPPTLLMYMANLQHGKEEVRTFDVLGTPSLELHRPFTEAQIKDIHNKLEWMQLNGSLSRDEWRDGIFALKAGIDDPVLLDEMLCKWTMNRSYVEGDEEQARAMAAKASKHGAVGPGTILSIIRNIQIKSGAPLPETPFTVQEIVDRSRVQYTIGKDGGVKLEASENNASALLGAIHDPDVLYHDVRSDFYIYKNKPYSDTQLVNLFIPMVQSPAYGLGLEKFRKGQIAAGLDILMATRRKDPHEDYLKSIKWDGISRVENFFVKYMGVPDSEYIRVLGKNFWAALAARGLRPGCKFDSMFVLEGHEGIAKSSFVQAVGGKYTYAPTMKGALDNLDALRCMHQSVIVELPELMGLINENSEKVKAFLAQPFDNIRGLYDKRATMKERGFIFVGTTNSDKYLAHAMGVRRFWPIRIPKEVKTINLQAIKADRDQLYAEGIALYSSGHAYWDMPAHLLAPMVETRVVGESLALPIKKMIPMLGASFTTQDVYMRLESSGVISRGFTNPINDRIESVLKHLDHCMDEEGNWSARFDGGIMASLQQMVSGMTLDSLI